MVRDLAAHRATMLDCCSLLNLFATGRIGEILRGVPARFAVAELVASEASYVRRGGGGPDAGQREAIDLQPLIAAGLLDVWRTEAESEFVSFVNFAALVDDGEAMTCALALHRDAVVVTDDRKARKLVLARAPQLTVLTTSQLLKVWADAVQVDGTVLKSALIDIQERARFTPGKQDPLLAWWQAVLAGP
ncbi:MAG: hypothetical protein HY331_04410 [Chloroflexi bacterium]|nr:hypothetical protein [Chloroflexota bacterium]